MKYLLLFSISPVQSFISQARKTQDLHAGSFLLTKIIDYTMESLSKMPHISCEFIYPLMEVMSKPNRFIAILDLDKSELENVRFHLNNYVNSKVSEIGLNILKSMKLNYSNRFIELFTNQIQNYFHVKWLMLPLDDNPNKEDYPKKFADLTINFGGIKNLKLFRQLMELGRKCSLCGERNVLFYRLTDYEKEKGGLKRRNDGLMSKLYVKKEEVVIFDDTSVGYTTKLQKGEGLCALCFIKRFLNKLNQIKIKKFPSTAEIAAMNWLQKIDKEELKGYEKLFNNFDEQLFYEENLTTDFLKKNDHYVNEQNIRLAKSKLNEFYKITIDPLGNELGRPLKYYALIKLDGDNMGRWLSGEYLIDKKNLLNFHMEISKKLSSYSKYVKELIDNPPEMSKGRVIYAGGDDVLGFVNLTHLFEVVSNLRNDFPKFEELGFELNCNVKSSASCGIAIAHYKAPLSEVMHWAIKMEKEAKSIDTTKDSFGIAVLKRSGDICKVILKWSYDDTSTIDIIRNILEPLQQGKFSNKFIKQFSLEFRKLVGSNGNYHELKLVKAELKRLITRSCQLKQLENETKSMFLERKNKEIEKLMSYFNLIIPEISFEDLLSLLDVIDFISRRGVPHEN